MKSALEALAQTALYKDHTIEPARTSGAKNHRRGGKGRLFPASHSAEPSSLQAECLLIGGTATILSARMRFLHPLLRNSSGMPPVHEAIEREVDLESAYLEELEKGTNQTFGFSPALEVDGNTERFQFAVEGEIRVSAERVGARVFRISVCVENLTPTDGDCLEMRTLDSVHLILQASQGEFLSLRNPPTEFRAAADACRNKNVWPVLLGEPGQRNLILVSPFALGDYPTHGIPSRQVGIRPQTLATRELR